MIYPDDAIGKIACCDCVRGMKLFPNQCIDLIITDIPYGINYKSQKQNYDTRSGKTIKIEREEYFQEIQNDDAVPIEWLLEAFRLLKDGSAIYIFSHWKTWGKLYNAVENAGFKIKNMIVLNKSNHGMGDLKGSYAPKHELLMFATKGRHTLNFPDKRENDIWDVKVKFSGSKRLHPNEKPLSWILPAILNSSNEKDIILDPFIGSGSTAEVCIENNRNFIGIDIDKQYVDIARKRINEKMAK